MNLLSCTYRNKRNVRILKEKNHFNDNLMKKTKLSSMITKYLICILIRLIYNQHKLSQSNSVQLVKD